MASVWRVQSPRGTALGAQFLKSHTFNLSSGKCLAHLEAAVLRGVQAVADRGAHARVQPLP